MSAPELIPTGRHAAAASLLGEIEPFHLVYFLLNVGDGDSQVLLLPEDPSGNRQIIVMDAAVKGKNLA
ncbi:MAG: hypothetical protein ACRDZM_04565, partial [Acidimicrobiia bacterium]